MCIRDSLQSKLRVAREMGTKDPASINGITARNVLHEELGYFGETPHNYGLDERTRDALLAHVRQDAAHALLNSITTLNELRRLKRLAWVTLGLVALSLMWGWFR